MQKIRWGIIGCGDVTEVKSGPAFNLVKDSELVAVMRRDAGKAKDYALRHQVPKWYSNAADLIQDPDINAIYIATPPSTHESYALDAIEAGKPVYVEKPMSVDAASAKRMADAARVHQVKLTVAHYRRAQPLFLELKQLLAQAAIGRIWLINCSYYKAALTPSELAIPKTAWRVNPAIAGGGLFHDLSPHQLDLMYFYFGEPVRIKGVSVNQAAMYAAADLVAGSVLFNNNIVFNGSWCFNVSPDQEKDYCEIVGEKGMIGFSFFEHKRIHLSIDGREKDILFDPLIHVQEPMIGNVVDYFLDRGSNPCSGEEGAAVMKMIDAFTSMDATS